GGEPDGPGPQHRGGDDGRGERRLVEEDHRGREGRNSRTKKHDQHDGGPAALLRFRSDARGQRSGYGREAGRAGRREGRRRYVEGSTRRPYDLGGEPDGPGAQHRGRDDRRGEG